MGALCGRGPSPRRGGAPLPAPGECCPFVLLRRHLNRHPTAKRRMCGCRRRPLLFCFVVVVLLAMSLLRFDSPFVYVGETRTASNLRVLILGCFGLIFYLSFCFDCSLSSVASLSNASVRIDQ